MAGLDYRSTLLLRGKCIRILSTFRRSQLSNSLPRTSISTSPLCKEAGKDGENDSSTTKWTFPDSAVLVYRWPTMVHFRILSRFKMYQIALMTAVLPYLLLKYKMGEVTGQAVGAGFSAAIGTSGILLAMTQFFMRVVGEMKYDPESKVVRLGMLSFWGNRVNHYIPLDKIVQFNESQTKMGGTFQKLKIEGHKRNLLYSLRYGRVMDFKLMCEALSIQREDLKYFHS